MSPGTFPFSVPSSLNHAHPPSQPIRKSIPSSKQMNSIYCYKPKEANRCSILTVKSRHESSCRIQDFLDLGRPQKNQIARTKYCTRYSPAFTLRQKENQRRILPLVPRKSKRQKREGDKQGARWYWRNSTELLSCLVWGHGNIILDCSGLFSVILRRYDVKGLMAIETKGVMIWITLS